MKYLINYLKYNILQGSILNSKCRPCILIGTVYLAWVLVAHAQKGLPAFGISGDSVQDMDKIALCLRIPVCMHNVPEEKIFRPACWNAYGMDMEGQDYRACHAYGPMYQ